MQTPSNDEEEAFITCNIPRQPGPTLNGHGYLQFFCLYTVPKFSSYYDSSIWKIVIAQMCISDSILQRAAGALGAAHHEHEILRGSQLSICAEQVSEIYAQAISDSRRTLTNLSLERAVTIGFVLSFLFAGIETLRGTYHNARMHLTNGLKIAFSRGYDTTCHKSTLLPDFNLIFEVLALLERLKRALLAAFDLHGEQIQHYNRRAVFSCPRDACLDAFREVKSIANLISSSEDNLENIQLFIERLDSWGTKFTGLLPTLSEESFYGVRLLKLYRETAYLMLLMRAFGHKSGLAQPGTLDNDQISTHLKAHFSKLLMLTDQLTDDRSFVPHLSPAHLRKFATKLQLFPSGSGEDSLESIAGSFSSLFARNAAEQLVMLEEDAIRDSGLIPLHSMCMDVTSAVERGSVSIRYCVIASDGSFLWVEKRAKLWRPLAFQDDYIRNQRTV